MSRCCAECRFASGLDLAAVGEPITHVDELEPGALAPSEVRQLIERHAPAAVVVHGQRGVLEQSFVELLAQRTESLHLPAVSSGATAHHSSIEAVAMIVEGELDEDRFIRPEVRAERERLFSEIDQLEQDALTQKRMKPLPHGVPGAVLHALAEMTMDLVGEEPTKADELKAVGFELFGSAMKR